MGNIITYRHWQHGDDDAILVFLPNTNEDWFRHKFDDPGDEDLEPQGIRLAFLDARVVRYVMGEPDPLFIEDKVQIFGVVTSMFVASDMRRQGIATRLMQDLNSYFERKGYRGSYLETDNEAAIQLYQKIGFQHVTRELRTHLPPSQNNVQLKWVNANLEDLNVIHQLRKRWVRQHFPIWGDPEDIVVEKSNLNDYRVLRNDGCIVGYVEWPQPSSGFSHRLISDPIAPDADPFDVIKSIQTEITEPLVWKTCEGSRYESSLCSLGLTLEPKRHVKMFLFIGREIDLTEHYRY